MKTKFLLILSVSFCACKSYIYETPKKYIYKGYPKSEVQQEKDSTALIRLLQTMLSENIHPFSPQTAYNKLNTTIFIDSILYSPDKDGVVILVITKSKSASPDSNKYFYNANYLYGRKDSIDGFRLYDYSSIGFLNFDSYFAAKSALLEYCFGRRATERPFSKEEPRYNMNDIRFWQGDQFKNIFKDSSSIISEKK